MRIKRSDPFVFGDPSEIHGRFPAQPLRQANFDPVIRPKQFQSFRAAPVLVVQEDLFAAIPTVHDVIDRAGALNPKGSGHAARSSNSERRHKTNVATWRTPLRTRDPGPGITDQRTVLKNGCRWTRRVVRNGAASSRFHLRKVKVSQKRSLSGDDLTVSC